MANLLVKRDEYGLPASDETLMRLLRNEAAVRVVTLIDVASVSTLELLEFGLTRQEIMYAFVNGLIDLDLRYLNADPDPATVSRIVNGRYDYWNSRKFVLSSLGLQVLNYIKGETAKSDVEYRFTKGDVLST